MSAKVKVRRDPVFHHWSWKCTACKNSGGGWAWDLVLDSGLRHLPHCWGEKSR